METNKRTIAKWTRWLHIYLSMFSFSAILFFAVTGLTLNHAGWIDGQQKVEQVKGNVPVGWVNPGSTRVDELKIVEYLRKTHDITAALDDFLIEGSECSVSFKGPGYAVEGFVDRATGQYELTITKSGFIAVINDLHKGRDTGTTWVRLIDVSAVLMILVSLTGFLMIFFLDKRRFSGLLIAGLGAVIIWVIYVLVDNS